MLRLAAIIAACAVVLAGARFVRGPALPILAAAVSHDLGYTDKDSHAWVKLPIRNTGNAELVLSNWRKGCSCIEASHGGVALPPMIRIGPGEELVIDLTVGTRKDSYLPGKYTFSFQSNDPHRPNHTLSISFNPVGGLLAVPSELDFGSCAVGSSQETASVVVYRTRFEKGGGIQSSTLERLNSPIPVSCI